MAETSITPEAFAERCLADNYFATQAVAAALSNPETEAVLNAALNESSSGGGGLQINSYYSFSYKPPALQINVAKPANRGNAAISPIPNQFTMVAYNGELTGFLVAAAKIIAKFPIGIVISALTQALFGTKAGPALLLLLLAI